MRLHPKIVANHLPKWGPRLDRGLKHKLMLKLILLAVVQSLAGVVSALCASEEAHQLPVCLAICALLALCARSHGASPALAARCAHPGAMQAQAGRNGRQAAALEAGGRLQAGQPQVLGAGHGCKAPHQVPNWLISRCWAGARTRGRLASTEGGGGGGGADGLRWTVTTVKSGAPGRSRAGRLARSVGWPRRRWRLLGRLAQPGGPRACPAASHVAGNARNKPCPSSSSSKVSQDGWNRCILTTTIYHLTVTTAFVSTLSGICQGMSWQHLHQPCVCWRGVILSLSLSLSLISQAGWNRCNLSIYLSTLTT